MIMVIFIGLVQIPGVQIGDKMDFLKFMLMNVILVIIYAHECQEHHIYTKSQIISS